MVPSAESSSSSSSTLLLPCDSFAFMRLLQETHHFSAVCEDDSNNKDINRLESDQVKDNHHQVCRRDCSFMADQEEPRSTTCRLSSKDEDNDNNSNNNNNNKKEAEDHEMRQEGWLRLSVGHEEEVKQDLDHQQQQHQTDPTATRDSFLELNLFSGGSNREEDQVGLPLSSLFQHQSGGGMMISPLMFPTRPEEMIGSWAAAAAAAAAAFRTPFVPQNLTQSSSSASLMMPLMGPYFGRSNFQPQFIGNNNNPDVVAGPSSSFRVIDPPRRPHSGIWFLLQASQNQ